MKLCPICDLDYPDDQPDLCPHIAVPVGKLVLAPVVLLRDEQIAANVAESAREMFAKMPTVVQGDRMVVDKLLEEAAARVAADQTAT